MRQQSLLDIDADRLFEEHGISDIQEVQSKIQTELEKMKEELRNIVGERYRNLLKAADTITEMKETTTRVISHVSQAQLLCIALREKRFLGFKQPSHDTKRSQSEDVTKMMDMKLFLSLLEHMWSAIDIKDYLWSCELYLLATHIYLYLQVTHSQALNDYPVLAKQWHVMTNTKNVVISNVREELKIIQLPFEQTSKCLGCLLLLQVLSVKDLVDDYLNLRLVKLDSVLTSNDNKTVKEKISVATILLQHTLAVVYSCFLWESGEALTLQEVSNITDDSAPTTVSKLMAHTSLRVRYFSQLGSEFRPTTVKPLEHLPVDVVHSSVMSWLGQAQALLAREITSLLNFVTDIGRVQQIQEEVTSLPMPPAWDAVAEGLVGDKSWKVYDMMMRSYVTSRVVRLVERVWSGAVQHLMTNLSAVDNELKRARLQQPENDIRWFVWEDSTDEVQQKTHGHTPRVVQLCSSMDSLLSVLLTDVTSFVGADTLKEVAVPLYLNECSALMVKRLADMAGKQCKSGTQQGESLIIVRARLLKALTTQCPSLEKIFKTTYTCVPQDSAVKGKMWSWQQAVAYLDDENLKLWRQWLQSARVKHQDLMRQLLDQDVSLSRLLASKPVNELFKIEEQSEDGTAVQSDIHVPSQPSLPLQQYLFRVCQVLNTVGPHTLPRVIHEEVTDNIVTDLVGHYEELCATDILYQPQCWQMLMDVRFLSLLLVPQDNKELVERVSELSRALQRRVDPFDLDVCYPYLQDAVKWNALRLQGTLGVLINFTDKLPVLNGLKLSSSAKQESSDPNVLAMSSGVAWFQLLPISAATGRSKPPTASNSSSSKAVISERPNRMSETKKATIFDLPKWFGWKD